MSCLDSIFDFFSFSEDEESKEIKDKKIVSKFHDNTLQKTKSYDRPINTTEKLTHDEYIKKHYPNLSALKEQQMYHRFKFALPYSF